MKKENVEALKIACEEVARAIKLHDNAADEARALADENEQAAEDLRRHHRVIQQMIFDEIASAESTDEVLPRKDQS